VSALVRLGDDVILARQFDLVVVETTPKSVKPVHRVRRILSEGSGPMATWANPRTDDRTTGQPDTEIELSRMDLQPVRQRVTVDHNI